MWVNGGLKLDIENKSFKIYNEKIDYADTFKYLGLWLEPNLKFEKHVSVLQSKINKQINVISRCRKYLTTSQSIFLFKTLVLPIFDYADIYYNSTKKEDLNHLQVLQNRCLRACYSRTK